ncbi:MAG: hypothetical protein HY275_15405 [Gemmatimonadetes bacterium]|nr:hypothetical protein [Gemmatimonadota bacterium]
MHSTSPATLARAVHAPSAPPAATEQGFALEQQVQQGLNLFLRLKSPAQMPALLAGIQALKPQIYVALTSLHYVHFARFLPSQDGSVLMVITEYDGDLESYLMDFVAVLGDAFNAMLAFVQDAPRLPVQRYPRDFVNWVNANNMQQVQPWSAYPDMTVIDIQNARAGS